MIIKKPSASVNIMTELIMPGHTNPLGNLMGGNLLKWMDVAAGISALKHAGHIAVTAAVDNVSFKAPIKVGDVVTIRSFVTRAFNTSMEVFCEVRVQNIEKGLEILSHTAFFTFVALNEWGQGIPLPQIEPETTRERELYDEALKRRELRLVLAGKIKAKDASSLQSFFN
ncbi:MAG: acyl-CoA thioesterase [Bacteroidetes bacterium]|nr:acyl-CoA thioesterase [Bacteroidota bacterium]